MTNAQYLARECAFSVLKAYNESLREVAPFQFPRPDQRERAQSAAIAAAEQFINRCATVTNSYWFDEKAEGEI